MAFERADGPAPPNNQEAEEACIGAILVHARAFASVAEHSTPEDFYHPALRAVYQAMVDLDEASKPIDRLTVVAQLRATDTLGRLRAFGGEGFLDELQSKVVTVENVGYYARLVRSTAAARRLIDVCTEIRLAGLRGEYGDVDAFIDASEVKLVQATSRRHQATATKYDKILQTTLRAMERRYERKQQITGVPCGYRELDLMLGGWQRSDLVIIAARPSMGKTAFVMNSVMRAATQFAPCRNCAKLVWPPSKRCEYCNAANPVDGPDPRVPALIFSIEMSKEALAERNICTTAFIDGVDARAGRLSPKDWMRITTYCGNAADAPVLIDDRGSPTLQEIRAVARRWRSDPRFFSRKPVADDEEHPLGVVVIDYLQLIAGVQATASEDNRTRELGKISGGLKALAKELRVPVIALSQLNRSLESRHDKRPMLSDLRESGAIEQDADVIGFIYRDEVYSKAECKDEDRGIAEFIIGKQRNGPTGTVRLKFLNKFARFDDEKRDDYTAPEQQAAPVYDDDRPPPTSWVDGNDND